jgi:hypothetical protein
MQVDPEEFRRRFADLSDDALLEINPDELVDTARELYDAELSRRGLIEEPAESQPAEGSPDDPKDEPVLAAEFGSAQELAFAQSLLKSSDIPTYNESDFSGILGTTEAATKLYVPASYLQQAQELLATPLTDEDLAEQAEAAGEESGSEEAFSEDDDERGQKNNGLQSESD